MKSSVLQRKIWLEKINITKDNFKNIQDEKRINEARRKNEKERNELKEIKMRTVESSGMSMRRGSPRPSPHTNVVVAGPRVRCWGATWNRGHPNTRGSSIIVRQTYTQKQIHVGTRIEIHKQIHTHTHTHTHTHEHVHRHTPAQETKIEVGLPRLDLSFWQEHFLLAATPTSCPSSCTVSAQSQSIVRDDNHIRDKKDDEDRCFYSSKKGAQPQWGKWESFSDRAIPFWRI